MLPVLWEMEDLGGQDGRSALAWLKGTGAERDLRRKDTEGMSLVCPPSFRDLAEGTRQI